MRAFLISIWFVRRALALYLSLLATGWIAGEVLLGTAIPEMRPMNEPLIHRLIIGSLCVFILAAAIPFVPGAEIGFALLLMFGAQASFIVYVGMIGALLLSYTVARFIPLGVFCGLAEALRLRRAAGFVAELSRVPAVNRADFIAGRLENGLGSTAFHNRYVVLALLLNMPGNSVFGGGGGLAFMAGISGLCRFWPFVISVLIAVAPFPLLFMILGQYD